MGNRISRSYSYNKRGLPTQELLQVDGFSFPIGYRYSSEGAVSELGYPDHTWEALNPDGLGRPRQMGQYASNITWHRFGPLAGFTYGNGLTFSQSLNMRGLPSARSDSWHGTARLSDNYSWDAHGNLTAINDLVGDANAYRNASRWMTYDGLDRLTVAHSSPQPPLRNPWSYSWGEARFGYDGLDNVRSFKMGTADFSYAYDGLGRLQNIRQAGVSNPIFTYTHNARGQMTGRQFGGQPFTLNWDTAHRVTQTSNVAANVTESYRYDAHGHRTRTVRGSQTMYQIYTQAGDLLWERSSNGSTRKYARLGGRLIGESVNGVRRAIQTDVIGSVRQKTDAMGVLVHEDVRAPYGSTLLGRSYQNGPAFTGHMEDGATGLTYMKARYYDPVAMRFISPDPVYVDLATGGNFNRYWYANNNPYTFVDPDGRCGTRIGGASAHNCTSYDLKTTMSAVGAASLSEASAKTQQAAAQSLDTAAAPWGGWDGLKDAIECIWACGLPGDGSLDAQLGAVPPILAVPLRAAAAGGTGGQLLYRYRNGAETATRLARGAADAQVKIGVHGVSVTTNPITGRACGAACREAVERVFPVVKTGADPNHFTVVLPNPVTREVAEKFNTLFQAIP